LGCKMVPYVYFNTCIVFPMCAYSKSKTIFYSPLYRASLRAEGEDRAILIHLSYITYHTKKLRLLLLIVIIDTK
jgi:hypothetical protein